MRAGKSQQQTERRECANRWHAKNVGWGETKDKIVKRRKCNSSSITASNLLTETVEQKLSLLRHGTRKRRERKRNYFFWKLNSREIMASAENCCQTSELWKGETFGKRNEKLTLRVQSNLHNPKRDAILKSISFNGFSLFFFVFCKKHIPLKPHRLCFILFMKTSGTVDLAKGTEREWDILKTHISNINLVLWIYELTALENRHF